MGDKEPNDLNDVIYGNSGAEGIIIPCNCLSSFDQNLVGRISTYEGSKLSVAEAGENAMVS